MAQIDTRPGSAAGESLVDPMLPHAAPIMTVQRETPDVFTLALDVSGRGQGLPFQPGQFTMLYLFGIGEVPISISGDPAVPMRLVHTIRAVGSVTRPMQDMKRGSMLGVRGPFGTGWPVEVARGKDILVVAGGLGLAPLRPLIYHLLNRREDYGHVSILYGARSPADILYRRELERWGGCFDVDVSVIVDHAVADWHGDVGLVTTLMDKVRCEPGNTIAMLCGPEIMMRFSMRALNHLGMADEQIYISMERNMQCAVGFCGHCQYGPTFVCKDGPVYRCDRIKPFFGIREI
ncbi:MAG: FAD/NAD(P)-binding protein [Pseudomonadota bacterium]